MTATANPQPAGAADPTGGGLLTFAAVAGLFPPGRGNRPVHVKTVARWADQGVRLRDGAVVKLEVIQLGQRRLCTRQAVRRFVAALGGAAVARPDSAALAAGSPPN